MHFRVPPPGSDTLSGRGFGSRIAEQGGRSNISCKSVETLMSRFGMRSTTLRGAVESDQIGLAFGATTRPFMTTVGPSSVNVHVLFRWI